MCENHKDEIWMNSLFSYPPEIMIDFCYGDIAPDKAKLLMDTQRELREGKIIHKEILIQGKRLLVSSNGAIINMDTGRPPTLVEDPGMHIIRIKDLRGGGNGYGVWMARDVIMTSTFKNLMIRKEDVLPSYIRRGYKLPKTIWLCKMDGDRLNDSVPNLCYGSPSFRMFITQYMMRGHAKLTDSQMLEIAAFYLQYREENGKYPDKVVLSKMYGFSPNNLQWLDSALNKKSYRWIKLPPKEDIIKREVNKDIWDKYEFHRTMREMRVMEEINRH